MKLSGLFVWLTKKASGFSTTDEKTVECERVMCYYGEAFKVVSMVGVPWSAKEMVAFVKSNMVTWVCQISLAA